MRHYFVLLETGYEITVLADKAPVPGDFVTGECKYSDATYSGVVYSVADPRNEVSNWYL